MHGSRILENRPEECGWSATFSVGLAGGRPRGNRRSTNGRRKAERSAALDDSLPLLTPMNEVAGRLSSVPVGAACLEKVGGGRGMLLGGVPGVSREGLIPDS
jgi:hypothetical protein